MVKSPALIPLFNELKSLLKPFAQKMAVRTDEPGRYELFFDRQFTTQSQRTGNVIEKDGLDFVAILIQKNYVGLYFMPIYSHAHEFKNVPDDVMSMLKGKSCFHIKHLNPQLEEELRQMLNQGYALYKNYDHA